MTPCLPSRTFLFLLLLVLSGSLISGRSPQAPAPQTPPPPSPKTLVWVDRTGNEQPVSAPARPYVNPRLSPDNRRLAVGIEAPGTTQVWLCDLPSCTFTQFTSQGTQNDVPVWTPDGKRVTFFSNAQGQQDIFWRIADGSAPAERLMPPTAISETPRSWSQNGNLLAYNTTNNPATGRDIWVFRLTDREASPFLATPALEAAPQFSPDGALLAYISGESGRPEVYVQRLQVAGGIGGKWQISTDGGTEPVWNPNGRELFYRNGDKMMVVEISLKPEFTKSQPKMLFERRYYATPLPQTNPQYDIASDGQRLLMLK